MVNGKVKSGGGGNAEIQWALEVVSRGHKKPSCNLSN